MAYDAYETSDKPSRIAMDRDYFDDSSDPRVLYSTHPSLHMDGLRDSSVSLRATESLSGRDDYGGGDNYRPAYVSASSADEVEAQTVSPTPLRAEASASTNNNVSPELIAEITERIKREGENNILFLIIALALVKLHTKAGMHTDYQATVVEHLKQTGSLEDQPKPAVAPPSTSNRTSETSSPTQDPPRVYTPPSPIVHNPKPSAPVETMDRRNSPPSSLGDRATSVLFEDGKGPAESSGSSYASRPPAARTYSTVELSTIDQKWGRLFENGEPTPRLGQFLRGLANRIVSLSLAICRPELIHLSSQIEEDSLKSSIVVTPEKMVTYYKNFPLDKEPHPFICKYKEIILAEV